MTGSRRLGTLLVCCGLAVLPWILALAAFLPSTVRVSNWSTAWVGLDALEALGLVTSGCLLLRRDARGSLTAAATAALLLVDVWVDVTTSAGGWERVEAVAMGLGAELPLAAVCAVLAVRSLPRRPAEVVPRYHSGPALPPGVPRITACRRLTSESTRTAGVRPRDAREPR
ncbi:hypothetical protein [Streptomyces sp. NPDC005423]|uniref:hypothetical protein n=1 Tax=Streptomyces sp. NPDC005423 TaxID=3155343 RepID=UPI0033B0B33E